MSDETSSSPGGGDAVIRLRGVTKRFDRFTAVDDVSLDIRRGEVFGLIGHNGAGKSTLFKMMLGLLAPTSGRIEVGGQPVHGRAAREVRRGIGYLPENVALWDNLSGLETLRFFARLKRVDAAGCPALLERVGLGAAGKKPVRAYSKGMRQRLGFAQALLGQPRVLFLDEPTTGLDPRAIHFFWDTLAELRDQGLTIVLTSHILAELQNRVDRVAVMASGKVQALGTLDELRAIFDLPLTVQASLAAGVDAGQAQGFMAAWPPDLAGFAHAFDGQTLTLRAPREKKMALLRHLLAAPQVADVQVHAPSLEDMFFSEGGAGVAASAQNRPQPRPQTQQEAA